MRTTFEQRSPVTAVAISPDAAWAVSIASWFMGPYEAVVRVWDLKQQAEKYLLQGHEGSVNAVAITADGLRILSGGSDGTLRIWDAVTGFECRSLAHKGSVTSLCALPDNRLAASLAIGYDRQSVKLWDIVEEKEIATLFDGKATIGVTGRDDYLYPVGLMAATRDGTRLLCATNRLDIWCVKHCENIAILFFGQEYVTALIPLPDNQRVFITLSDGRFIVYDHEKDKILIDRQAHLGVAWDAALSADGRLAITCGSDAAVRCWDLTDYREIATFVGDGLIRTCDISDDGTVVVAGTALGQVHFLRLRPEVYEE